MIRVPEGAAHVIGRLEAAGHEAWAVGGCVRDSLLGLLPHDWDICTGATPDQTLAAMAGLRVIETGIKHGTVTVMWEGAPFEVTTYRADGDYSDSRRPDSVSFVRTLKEDLSRRDFTVNAMAYHPRRGLYDAFGGAQDLQNRVIRCVGDPAARFLEDALRILRALRFAATYGFSIHPDTAKALLEARERLLLIAPERIREELLRLLTGPGAADVLRDFAPVIFAVLPELAPMAGFAQHNPHHHLDVWEHTLAAVSAAPPDSTLRFVMLFHDAGKPASFFQDEKGIGHFYGHPQRSLDIARKCMLRLRFDNRTREAVEELVLVHDAVIPPKDKKVLAWLGRLGEDGLRALLAVKRADAMGQNPHGRQEKLQKIAALEARLSDVLARKLPYQLKDLAVTGNDLMALGMAPGPRIGQVLELLLKQVMGGGLENERQALLKAADRMRR